MRLRSALACTLAWLGAAGVVACPGSSGPAENEVPLPDRILMEDADEADAADGPNADEATPDTATPDAAKPLRVFVSSALVTGNIGGIPDADKLCTSLATNAGLGGTYGAWLSVPGADAIDHITSSGPWQLVTGARVADNKLGLTTGELKHLINVDEKGVTVLEVDDHAWTGTGANGRYAGPDCSLWTSIAGNGSGGDAAVAGPGVWTAVAVLDVCSGLNRIYCFEL